jgi:hypothetical protein
MMIYALALVIPPIPTRSKKLKLWKKKNVRFKNNFKNSEKSNYFPFFHKFRSANYPKSTIYIRI